MSAQPTSLSHGTPTFGLAAAVVEALRSTRPLDGPEFTAIWERLTKALSPDEAQALPSAFGVVLPLLAGDPERLRLAVDLLVEFDLYEAQPAVVQLAERGRDANLVLAAAALAVNPGVERRYVDRVAHVAAVTDLSVAQRRALTIRRDPFVEAASLRERSLQSQLWPGLFSGDSVSVSAGPPVVAIDHAPAHPQHHLEVLGAVRAAGAIVRRLPARPQRPVRPQWLPDNVAVISWDPRAVSATRQRGAPTSARIVPALVTPASAQRHGAVGHRSGASKPRSSRSIIEALNQITGGRLRLTGARPPRGDVPSNPLDPEVLHAGTYDALEMAYLAGGRRELVYRFTRRGHLSSRTLGPRGRPIWAFDQLIGLRVWQYFQEQAPPGRRLDPRLMQNVRELAGEPDPAEVQFSATGQLLRVTEDTAEDVRTRQHAFAAIVRLDAIFQPFRIGGGMVPDLFAPAGATAAHPTVMGGTPTVPGRRISARGLALVRRLHGIRAAQEMYPELGVAEIEGAAAVGDDVFSST